jgi:hypothetical protein
MVAIITGDLINSRKIEAGKWMNELKNELKEWGEEGKDWEIYRGDSFQVKIKAPEQVLYVALLLKSAIKSIAPLDIRMGLGIGNENYSTDRLLENNGSAYIYSGEAFEELHKQHIMFRCGSEELNLEINLLLRLGLTIMDNWSENSARMVNLAFKNPSKNQTELGVMENISQNSVSARLTRANYDEIKALLAYFSQRIAKYVS